MDKKSYSDRVMEELEHKHNLAMEELYDNFRSTSPFDKDGKPTSQLASHIIEYFFENRNKKINVKRVAVMHGLRPDMLEIMLEQMQSQDLLTSSAKGIYQYNINCENTDYQANVEKWMELIREKTSYGKKNRTSYQTFFEILPVRPNQAHRG